MKAKRINDLDIAELKISSLPSRPTAPRSFGGRGYTATEMKEAFDKLPLYIIERFNELISDVGATGEDSLASAMPTGIREGHTLADLFADLTSGALAAYMLVSGMTLSECIENIRSELSKDRALIADHNARLTDHGEAIGENEERIASAEGRITANESAIAAANARIDALDTSGGSGGSVDTENIVLDCGTPEALIKTEGGNE